MRRRPTQSSGFVLYLAIVMLGLLSAVFVVLLTSFRTEMQRNAGESNDAQLRQLLLAGTDELVRQVNQRQGKMEAMQFAVAVPADAPASIAVAIHQIDPASIDATVMVACGQTQMSQHVTLSIISERWRLLAVDRLESGKRPSSK